MSKVWLKTARLWPQAESAWQEQLFSWLEGRGAAQALVLRCQDLQGRDALGGSLFFQPSHLSHRRRVGFGQ